jgi:hypothetical protein
MVEVKVVHHLLLRGHIDLLLFVIALLLVQLVEQA